jgi:hypothetical protein
MRTEDILEKLDMNDLTPDLQLIAEKNGIDAVKELFRTWDGLPFYVPKFNRIPSLLKKYVASRPGVHPKVLAKEIGRPVSVILKLLEELEESKN